MATSKKISPNRRKSICVPTQNQPSLVPKNRRRAHSIVLGASLSPFSKARRSLVPRKSILKSSLSALNVNPSSQESISTLDDANATRSMDITQDLSAPVHDNTTRKSFGRRVSFASKTQVRMFKKPKNSTGSPQSSPDASHYNSVSNENDYPGQNSRRRSSARYSIAGSEDMDLTTVMAPGNFHGAGSAILDEEFDHDDDNFSDDMEVTEAIQGNFLRKHSLSMGRRPLSQSGPSREVDESQSDIGDDSVQSEGTSEEHSQAMEFTVPLGQSLRPPAERDEVWLALKQMTHSGNEPPEPDLASDDSTRYHERNGMDLDIAMERLKRARDSLPLSSQITSQVDDEHAKQDDTFTSTEDSFESDNDGNKTMNLSQVMGRDSMARMSLDYQDSNMDESEVYGNVAQSTPRPSLLPLETPRSPVRQPIQSSVFQPPPRTILNPTSAPIDTPSSTSRADSPSKSKPPTSPSKGGRPKPTFTAAFAPPVTKPSPKKATAPATQVPIKRPRPSQHDGLESDLDRPSPAKKQALVDRWMGIKETKEDARSASEPTAAKGSKPKPLSPSKKALFQSSSTTDHTSGIKRPSGYFARRKSLAVGFNQPSTSQKDNTAIPSSPTKISNGVKRLSLGSAPSDVWRRFERSPGSAPNNVPVPSSKMIDKGAENNIRQQASEVLTPQTASSPERLVAPAIVISQALEDSQETVPNQDTDIDVEGTQQWREGVEPGEYAEDEQTPSISIVRFFQMTGIKFMDELTAPRRSLHPGSQPFRQARNVADIPLAEFVTAMAIDVPQLDLYSRVSRDLEAWMEKSKLVFAQAEEEAEKVTPELFAEYARADDEGKDELLHQLNLIRTHTRYLARSDWYDWKYQWVDGLRVTAEEAFKSLETDARVLEGLMKTADDILPDLEKEYEQLMQELEQEESEVKEIESCDQDYLNELKASIAEQNIEIEALKAELLEAKEQSNWIREKLDEIETQRHEAQNTIRMSKRVLQMKQTSTRSEVFRLKGELEALEDLHMFRITKVDAKLFEYVYNSLFLVSIPCKNFIPIVSKVDITRYGKENTRYKDNFPKLSAFLLSTAKYLINEGENLTVREIVHRLSDYWSSCLQLRSQLTLLRIKYPVEIIVSPAAQYTPPLFKAKTQVMFPSIQGKAFISFVFSLSTFSKWPTSIGLLDCEVDVVYGPMERSAVLKAVMDRLSQVTPAQNYACLLDACIEAQEVYH